MKLNTNVVAGIRNVGDSQDAGEYFSGPLNEAILFIATRISKIYLATRVQISIARTEDEAARGLELARKTPATKVTDDMREMLDRLMADSEGEDDPALGGGGEIARIPGDDYIAPEKFQ